MTTHAGTLPSDGRRRGLLVGLLAGVTAAVVLVLGGAAEATLAAPQATPAPAMALHAEHAEPNPVLLRALSRQLGLADDDEAAGVADEAGDPGDDAEAEAEAEATEADADAASNTAAPTEVFWTVLEEASPELIASQWGLGQQIYALNPALRPGERIAAGTVLKVYAADPEKPTRSIGAPNRGRLQSGMPLPEGEAWRLRTVRRRAYGSTVTVSTLLAAFTAYGERFPDAPKWRVGELAGRKGGKARPHRSHRSGRDVDIGYVALGDDDGDIRWQRMHAGNFDAEKNWFLIHEMIKSGAVEAIFISKKLQPLLYEEAKKALAPEELAAIFQHPRHEDSAKAIIRHWKGHRDHMHVRFRCEAENRRCRGERVPGADGA